MNNSIIWSPGMRLDVLEQQVIVKAFRFYHENKTATANSLGISIRTLDSRLEKYEMDAIEEDLANAERKDARAIQLARSRGQVTGFDNAATVHIGPYSSQKAVEGVRMESIANATSQPNVSVPERQEVQEVLPRDHAPNHSRKAGR